MASISIEGGSVTKRTNAVSWLVNFFSETIVKDENGPLFIGSLKEKRLPLPCVLLAAMFPHYSGLLSLSTCKYKCKLISINCLIMMLYHSNRKVTNTKCFPSSGCGYLHKMRLIAKAGIKKSFSITDHFNFWHRVSQWTWSSPIWLNWLAMAPWGSCLCFPAWGL